MYFFVCMFLKDKPPFLICHPFLPAAICAGLLPPAGASTASPSVRIMPCSRTDFTVASTSHGKYHGVMGVLMEFKGVNSS